MLTSGHDKLITVHPLGVSLFSRQSLSLYSFVNFVSELSFSFFFRCHQISSDLGDIRDTPIILFILNREKVRAKEQVRKTWIIAHLRFSETRLKDFCLFSLCSLPPCYYD